MLFVNFQEDNYFLKDLTRIVLVKHSGIYMPSLAHLYLDQCKKKRMSKVIPPPRSSTS